MNKYLSWFLTLSWAGLTLYLTTIPNISPSPDTIFSWLLSNGGHFFFFGILAVLLKLDKLSDTYAVLLASTYGLAIEFIQLNISGRSFDLKDWMLDTLGAIAFLFIMKKLQSRL